MEAFLCPRWYMERLALHLHSGANTTKVGGGRAHGLRLNQLLDPTVCHMRLMNKKCALPDAQCSAPWQTDKVDSLEPRETCRTLYATKSSSPRGSIGTANGGYHREDQRVPVRYFGILT